MRRSLVKAVLGGSVVALLLFWCTPAPDESAHRPDGLAAAIASAMPPPPPAVAPTPEPAAPSPARPAPTSAPIPANSGIASHGAANVQRWITKPGQGEQPPAKTVFLTFDDGPAELTASILDVLSAKQVRATFFVSGSQATKRPDLLRRTQREGHAVAIHTFSHDYKELYPGRTGDTEAIIADYDKALAAVRAVLGDGYSPTAYRYPGGHMSWKGLAEADAALAERGVHWIDWNAMTGDAEPPSRRPKSVDGAVAMATAGIESGTSAIVVLAHDTRAGAISLQALPRVIDTYRAAGYSFGIIS
ncbi:MAG: polysaccharide deacetylase family protein [Propionibacteriaceae bacterium]|nr:polysaccharide deacetylase family protein [Propionibacteriaceae bacterium]